MPSHNQGQIVTNREQDQKKTTNQPTNNKTQQISHPNNQKKKKKIKKTGNRRRRIKSGGDLMKDGRTWCEHWAGGHWGVRWGALSAQGTGGCCLVCWALLRNGSRGGSVHVALCPPCFWDPPCYHVSSSWGHGRPARPGPGGYCWGEVPWLGGNHLLVGPPEEKKVRYKWGLSMQERIVHCTSTSSQLTALHSSSPYGFLLLLSQIKSSEKNSSSSSQQCDCYNLKPCFASLINYAYGSLETCWVALLCNYIFGKPKSLFVYVYTFPNLFLRSMSRSFTFCIKIQSQ